MTRTESGQTIYRKHFIPGHPQQCFAAALVMFYLKKKYKAGYIRHRKRLILALKNMEGKL